MRARGISGTCRLTGSLGLQILVFPFEAGGSGPGEESDLAFPVLHFPFLSGVVEVDVRGPDDLQVAKVV